MILKLNMKNNMFLYSIPALVTISFAFILKTFLSEKSFLYNFLFQCWPIQFLNSWLFLTGIVYWIQRYLVFRDEEKAFQKIGLPEFPISHEIASKLIKNMPDEYKQTLTLRRFREILQAFLYGEDIIRLNEELSRRDIAEVERGHLVLNSLRNIIPVIGFLGTVLGLSLGMLEFPEISEITKLREALRDFAASLNVAFNTTLLALGYTIVIILLTSFLRQREEALVSKIDERARKLIEKIKVRPSSNVDQPEKGIEQLSQILNNALVEWRKEFLLDMKGFLEKVFSQNGQTVRQMEQAINKLGEIFAQKFDELREGLQQPPRYQIVVKPLEEKKDE